MAEFAQRVLMNEFKALSKETWTNIEVCRHPTLPCPGVADPLQRSTVLTTALVTERQRLRMERRAHRAQPRLTLLRRLLQGQNDLPPQLPSLTTRYVTSPRLDPAPNPNRNATLTNSHADFKFVRPLYHPNIYPDGRLCISILHPPGDDEMSGELAAERWSPAQRAETVLLSILSLLDDAETSSPANVDAGVMLRNAPEAYRDMVKKDTEASKQDIPADFVMPTSESAWKRKEEEGDFEMSWEDSDVESFGGSDSESDFDEEMDSDLEEEEDEEDK